MDDDSLVFFFPAAPKWRIISIGEQRIGFLVLACLLVLIVWIFGLDGEGDNGVQQYSCSTTAVAAAGAASMITTTTAAVTTATTTNTFYDSIQIVLQAPAIRAQWDAHTNTEQDRMISKQCQQIAFYSLRMDKFVATLGWLHILFNSRIARKKEERERTWSDGVGLIWMCSKSKVRKRNRGESKWARAANMRNGEKMSYLRELSAFAAAFSIHSVFASLKLICVRRALISL